MTTTPTRTRTRYIPMRDDESLGPAMSRTAAIKVLHATVQAWRARNHDFRSTGHHSAPKGYRRSNPADWRTEDGRFPEWDLRRNGEIVARVYLREDGTTG